MIKRPQILQPGDRVAVVALSSRFDKKTFNAAVKAVRNMGLEPVFERGIFKKDFYFAGTPEERFGILLRAFKDSKAKAIWCVRGGYGSFDLIPMLAKKNIRVSPKIFIGYSDVCALHFYLNQKWNWPTLHAPLFTRLGRESHKGLEKKVLHETLFNSKYRLKVNSGLKALGKKAKVTGILAGGNLSIVQSSLRTLWEINTDGKVLFLEDIYESGKKIDRMFAQLWQAGKFDKVKAVVFGDFTECFDKESKKLWLEAIKRRFNKAHFPVLLGLKAGHDKVNLSLPLGVKVRVSTKGRPSFEVLEGFARE
jgi:muramoyltetrapeptide carboxypeptidase